MRPRSDRRRTSGPDARGSARLRPALLALSLVAALLVGCAAPTPPAGNVVVDADVRGCESPERGALGPLDVVLALDTSQSTGRPTGIDLNGDGVVHDDDYDRQRVRGDSRLAAQVAAARSVLRNVGDENVRFSLVRFSGPNTAHTAGRTHLVGSRRDSTLLMPLTSDRDALDAELAELLEQGAEGKTIFYAGMRRATRELAIDDEGRWRRRLILLISDSPEPTGLASDGKFMNVDWRMKHAAVKARRKGVVIHTFGLSPRASDWRDRPLGRIAGATGGNYHPVEDPRRLACHLTTALRPPQRYVRRVRAFVETKPASPETSPETPGEARLATIDDREIRP